MNDVLWQKSAMELAELIRTKQASSREIVDAHLDRIDEVNGDLNAIVLVLAEEARAEASKADDAVVAGKNLGALHGVPMTVKENLDLVGTPTTSGMAILAEAMPTMDAPVVERMRAAGAIPIGRTNLPEMGLRMTTDNPLRGLTRNPWHPDITAGGSSGGEASAIASGMSPIGIGNDIGGSLRNPAFCCGITALKPTQGRVPFGTSIEPLDQSLASSMMSTSGPMARTVADVKLGLELMAGRHVRDLRSITVPFDSGEAAKKVALVTSVYGGPIDSAFIEATREAGRALEAQGFDIEEVELPDLEQTNTTWSELLSASIAPVVSTVEGLMDPETWLFLKTFTERFRTEGPIDTVIGNVGRLGRAWSEFLAQYPIIVTPLLPKPACTHGADIAGGKIEVTLEYLQMTTPANLLGLPAGVVPTGLIDGMPFAVQIMADRFADDRILAAASIIEAASPTIWSGL